MRTTLRRMAAPGGPLRYAAAGLVNSAFGYAGILGAALAGLPPVPANALGFLIGLGVSWFVARAFTFAPPERAGAPARYAAAFLGCWALNAAAMTSAMRLGVPAFLAQGGGVAVYAASFYLACRWWVFGGAPTLRRDLALARSAVPRDPARLFLAVVAASGLAALPAAFGRAGQMTLIAHGGGGLGDRIMTNSVDAMAASAAAGVSLIEIDLHRLADGQVVCAHDWDAFGGAAPDRATWEAAHRDGPRPCTAETAGAWLRRTPGVAIVTDVKADQLGVLSVLADADWPKDRTIVQIYDPAEADPVAALGFGRQIVTLYRYAGPVEPVVALAAAGRVEAVTMPRRHAHRGGAGAFAGTGVPVYVHTVNGWAAAGYFGLRGADGVYTDNTQAPAWHPFGRAPAPGADGLRADASGADVR